MRSWILMLALFVPAGGLFADLVTRQVTYHDGQVELVGYLAYDDAVAGKRPGVLVVHEWWGLNDYARKRARMLAELGYVAFAADMYGQGKVTADPTQAGQWAGHMKGDVVAWRKRAVAGLRVLKSQPQTDAQRTAAIGYCFGGSTVLELAIAGVDVDAVVSFHGSLPAIKPGADISAKVLVCHGADDSFIKPDSIATFTHAMNASASDWMMVSYGGAEHSFTNPGADAHGIDGVKYDQRADTRSWLHMHQWLADAFAPGRAEAAEPAAIHLRIKHGGTLVVDGKVIDPAKLPRMVKGRDVVLSAPADLSVERFMGVIERVRAAEPRHLAVSTEESD